MNRMASALVVAMALVVAPAVTFANGTADPQKPPTAKAMTVVGSVTAVATDSLTVKGKEGEVKLAIDKDTVVTAKGASHKSLELKAEGKSTKLTDFVKVGDAVTVSYKDGATKLATNIRVTTPAVK